MHDNQFTRFGNDAWRLTVIVLSPLIVLTIWLWAHFSNWDTAKQFLRINWGNIASVWGLIVGVYVLVVARGAKRAAEETILLSRKKSLLEELEDADKRIQQVGLFIRQEKWDLVVHVSSEVLASCRSIVTRWGDLPESSSNSLLEVIVLIRSIAEAAASAAKAPPTERQRIRISKAQLDAVEKLSATLGHCRRLTEGAGEL